MTHKELSEKLDGILAEFEDSYVPVTHIISGKTGYCLVNPNDKNDVLFVPEHPSNIFDQPTKVFWSEVTPRLSVTRQADFKEFIYRATREIGTVGSVSIQGRYFNSKAMSKLSKLLKENFSFSCSDKV